MCIALFIGKSFSISGNPTIPSSKLFVTQFTCKTFHSRLYQFLTIRVPKHVSNAIHMCHTTSNPCLPWAVYPRCTVISKVIRTSLRRCKPLSKFQQTLCHLSYSHFAKLFRENYGRSCKEYIQYIRMNKAQDLLLNSDFDINYIAQETGFYDCSHFIRQYKKWRGITPKQDRKNKCKKIRKL